MTQPLDLAPEPAELTSEVLRGDRGPLHLLGGRERPIADRGTGRVPPMIQV